MTAMTPKSKSPWVMAMKRTVPWAVIAFFPLASLLVVTLVDPEAYLSRLAVSSDVAAFMLTYWWSAVLAAILIQMAWFLVSAIRNHTLPVWRRIIWSVAMVLVGPVAAPAYWWVYSARGG
jgi:hypothetical protein